VTARSAAVEPRTKFLIVFILSLHWIATLVQQAQIRIPSDNAELIFGNDKRVTCCRFAGGCDLCATHALYFTGGLQIKLRWDDALSGFAGKSSNGR
jgi:hypothetical protein